MMKHLVLLALTAVLATEPVSAQQVLPPGQLNAEGNLKLGPVTLGRCQSGELKTTSDTLQILRAVSTGDVSGTSVRARGTPVSQPLSTWLTTPFFAATASPLDTDAYASGRITGKAAMAVVSSDASRVTGKERYAGFFAYTGPGTGDPAIIGTSFGIGVSALKQNWFSNMVPGQIVGANIVVRGGYHGPDTGSAPPELGSYNPGGDTTALIVNTVNSSQYSHNAILEGVAYNAQNGAFSANGQLHGMNVQLGAIRLRNPDGTPANPGIGLALAAQNGSLGYAIQANNTARAGSYEYGVPGIWGGFLRYNLDDGTRTPYDAFRVDQDGAIFLSSGEATTPSKRLHVGGSGDLQVLNHAGTAILSLADAGALTIGAGANARAVQTVPGAWTAYSGALQFDSSSTATGTFNARYEIVGKRLTLTATFNVSAAGGTPGGAAYVPLPSGSVLGSVCPGTGNEFVINGKALNVRAQSSANRLTVTNFDNTSPIVSGAQAMISVACEVQ